MKFRIFIFVILDFTLFLNLSKWDFISLLTVVNNILNELKYLKDKRKKKKEKRKKKNTYLH